MLIDVGVEIKIPGDRNPINLAATVGSVECLKELLTAHANKEDSETTPLNVNAVSNIDTVKELMSANVKQPEIEALISGVRTGKAELVEELIKSRSDVNVQDEYGNTALMTAIKVGSKPVFQLLINYGAEINAENNKGETALYLAVRQSHVEYERMQTEEDQNRRKCLLNDEISLDGSSFMVYTLLREGAHLHKTKSGLNPCTVHLTSAELKDPNPTVLKLLDVARSKENIKKLSSVNLLQDCTQDCIREHLKQTNPEGNLYFTVPQLGLPKRLQSSLLFGAVQKYDLVPNSGEREFLQKIKECDTKSTQLLINTGVDVNVQDENGMTALMIASQGGQTELVEQLIKAGADVNIQNASGDTALIYAFKGSTDTSRLIYEECVQLLIQNHAKVNIQGKDGVTALMHLAKMISCYLRSVSKFGIRNFTKKPEDLVAMENCMFALMDAGADPNLKNDKGRTALMLSTNSLNFVEEMIKAGADVNWKDKGGSTALMLAAAFGHNECVQLLIQEGADLNIRTKNGDTALTFAVTSSSGQCFSTLLKAGAEVDSSLETTVVHGTQTKSHVDLEDTEGKILNVIFKNLDFI